MTTDNAIVVTEPEKYDNESLALLKRTICKGASDDEFLLFTNICKRLGLDPFARQLYPVFRNVKQGNGWGKVMTVQTGIDGYRAIAERTGNYAGSDDPAYDDESGEHPNKATVTIYKIVNGQRYPFTASARWREYAQTDKDGKPTKFWAQMPYLMLGKVAEALALRKAFPFELSGIYTSEEMQQAENGHSEPTTAPTTAEKLKQQAKGNVNPLADKVKSDLGGVPANENGEPKADPSIVEQIKALLIETKIPVDRQSEWMGNLHISSWSEISVEDANKLLNKLEKRKVAMIEKDAA